MACSTPGDGVKGAEREDPTLWGGDEGGAALSRNQFQCDTFLYSPIKCPPVCVAITKQQMILGVERAVEPVEPKPLHYISVVQVLAMKQEAPPFGAG